MNVLVRLLPSALLFLACSGDDCDFRGRDGRCSEPQATAAPTWPVAYGSELEFHDEASVLFDRYEPSRIELDLPEERWEYLNTNAVALDESTKFLAAELTINGDSIGTVGLRPKGGFGTLRSCFEAVETDNPTASEDDETQSDETQSDESSDDRLDFSRLKCSKLSYKIKFGKYQKGFSFKGLERLNLHSLIKDPSLMRDYIAYGLFRRMGVPAPRVGYAEVYVNGQLLGLFGMIEEIDEAFLESRFPDAPDGNLYKNQWLPGGGLAAFERRLRTNNDGSTSHRGLERVSAALASATDEELPEVVTQWFDVDRLVSFLEVEQAMLNWDGPLSFRVTKGDDPSLYGNHNYYLYQPDAKSPITFIPWDMDNSLDGYHAHVDDLPDYRDLSLDCDKDGRQESSRGDRIYLAPVCDPVVRGAALASSSKRRKRMLAKVFRVARIHRVTDWLEERLVPAVTRDPTLRKSHWWNAVDDLKDATEVLEKRARGFADD